MESLLEFPCSTLEFLNKNYVCTETPIMCQFQFKFSYPGSVSSGSFCSHAVPPIVICHVLYLPLSLQFLEQKYLPDAYRSQISLRNIIDFQLIQPVVRTEATPSKLLRCWNGSQKSPCSP